MDVYFENFLSAGTFTTGTLVHMNLTVPNSFSTGLMTISAVPDTLDNGLGSVLTTAGTGFTLNVVPEPSSLALLVSAGIVGVWAFCRRRRGR